MDKMKFKYIFSTFIVGAMALSPAGSGGGVLTIQDLLLLKNLIPGN